MGEFNRAFPISKNFLIRYDTIYDIEESSTSEKITPSVRTLGRVPTQLFILIYSFHRYTQFS